MPPVRRPAAGRSGGSSRLVRSIVVGWLSVVGLEIEGELQEGRQADGDAELDFGFAGEPPAQALRVAADAEDGSGEG